MKTIIYVLVVLIAGFSRVRAFDPYVFERTKHEYSYGGYAVIDSAKSVVVSTGNIIAELLADPTFYAQHEFLVNNDAIGDYYIDRKFGRLFVWTGLRDEYYDGSMVIRLADRSLLAYIRDGGGWGQASAVTDVGPNNVIYEMSWSDFGGPSDPVENAKEAENIGVYDGETYKKIKFTQVPEFGISMLSSCFMPGENKIYDDLNGGLFDVEKNELIRPKSNFLKNNVQLDCKNGKILLAQDKDYVQSGSTRTVYVYDVLTDTVTQKILPDSANSGWSSTTWKLSPDAKYAIWARRLDGGGHHVDAVVAGGRALVFETATGRQVYELDLPKLLGHKPHSRRYVFAGFSVDGNKLLFHDDKNIYVFDLRGMKIVNQVRVPFYPDFIVWP